MDSTVVPPNESKLGIRRRILQQQRSRQSSAANGQHELASHAWPRCTQEAKATIGQLEAGPSTEK
jgi:hypothetical protein